MPEMVWIWFGLLVVFAIVEASTVTLVSLWFIGGCIAALIATILGAEIWLQVLLFLAVSIVLLLCLRPLLRKYFTPKKVQTNAPANIGKLTVVTEEIDNLHDKGAVRLSGVIWSAKSVSGEKIPVGTVVCVREISGVKVCVEPAPAEITKE